jgi:DNA-binding NtrC family response regulator
MSEEFDSKTLEAPSQLGIQDYLIKPLTINQLKSILTLSPEHENKKQAKEFCHYDKLVGASAAMQTLYYFMHRVAKTSASVFIIGESGTGKELIAQAIQRHSLRADKPFIAVNCGAISSELIASALFGHEKGSFTGAVQAHTGYFEQASGGTLFLDEITETSQDFQIKLLRVLETGIVTPVGGKREIEVDVRIIASTNRCPELAIQQGILRKDLYHRLNVFPIYTPSLNQRKDDIFLLANYFLKVHNENDNNNVKYTPAALKALKKINYTGNIRQLKNIIHRAYILADEYIDVEQIMPQIQTDSTLTTDVFAASICGTSLKNIQHQFINATLAYYDGDHKLTAENLGISQKELHDLLKG